MNKIKQFFTNLFNRGEKPEFNVGDEVTYISGRYYHDSNGSLPYGFKRRGENVFVTKVNLLGTEVVQNLIQLQDLYHVMWN